MGWRSVLFLFLILIPLPSTIAHAPVAVLQHAPIPPIGISSVAALTGPSEIPAGPHTSLNFAQLENVCAPIPFSAICSTRGVPVLLTTYLNLYTSIQFPFAANGRALGQGAPGGFVKIIADAKTDRILGAHIIHAHASELIQELVVAMEFKAASEDIARIVHGHPTLSEAVREAALAVDKRTLNM